MPKLFQKSVDLLNFDSLVKNGFPPSLLSTFVTKTCTQTLTLSRIHPHTQRAFFACTNVICCFIHLRAHLSASQVVPPVQMHSSSGWPWALPPSGTLGLPRCYSGLWHHSGRLQHIQYAAVAHGPQGTGTWWGLWTIRKEVWWIDTNRMEWRRFSPWKESSSSPWWKPVLWKTEPFLTSPGAC